VNLTLDWNTVLTLASTLVAVYSLIKMQSARQAARVARQKLLNQRAVEEFDEMARGAANLSMVIRNQEWRQCAELSTTLRISLARANGSWPGLLRGIEKDKLEAAGKGMQSLAAMIPAEGTTLDGNPLPQMIEQCNFMIDVAAEIAGRLKYLEED